MILFQASAEPWRHIVEEPLEGWEPYHLENHSLAAEGKVEKLKKEEQPFTITIAADKKRRFWGVKDRRRVREKLLDAVEERGHPPFSAYLFVMRNLSFISHNLIAQNRLVSQCRATHASTFVLSYKYTDNEWNISLNYQPPFVGLKTQTTNCWFWKNGHQYEKHKTKRIFPSFLVELPN